MTALLILIFLAFAVLAAGFVVWPILRRREDPRGARMVLAASAALFVIAAGSGVYLWLGSPGLALRSLAGPKDNDLRGLIAELVSHVRAHPGDMKAWSLLGRGYLTLGDPGDAAGAFKQAAALAPPDQRPDLLASYGEAMVFANNGAVPDAALEAFKEALAADPKNASARYYMGLAYANRRQTQKALGIWQGLLADAPPNASWRPMLVDRIAKLKAQSGGVPDVGAMVAGLAARLKTAPNDPGGWQRLIRAYSVLGETAKAQTALSDARAALKGNAGALSAIDAEAESLGLEK